MACVSKVCLLTEGNDCKKAADCQSGLCERGKCAVDPVAQAANVLDDAMEALQSPSADRQKVLQEEDTNCDGRPDIRYVFEAGTLVRKERVEQTGAR